MYRSRVSSSLQARALSQTPSSPRAALTLICCSTLWLSGHAAAQPGDDDRRGKRLPEFVAEDLNFCAREIAELHRQELLDLKRRVERDCLRTLPSFDPDVCRHSREMYEESSATSNLKWFANRPTGGDLHTLTDVFGMPYLNRSLTVEDALAYLRKVAAGGLFDPAYLPTDAYDRATDSAFRCLAKVWLGKHDPRTSTQATGPATTANKGNARSRAAPSAPGDPGGNVVVTLANGGTGCLRVSGRLDIDSAGSRFVEMTLKNTCAKAQLLDEQVDVTGEAPGTTFTGPWIWGSTWIAWRRDTLPTDLGFKPERSDASKVLGPNQEKVGRVTVGEQVRRVNVWLASCDAYTVEGSVRFSNTMFQAKSFLADDSRVACRPNFRLN